MSSKPPPSAHPGPQLAKLRLRGFRCFDDVEVPLDPHVTVILGENGSGKTTIAEAIASLAAGDREGLDAFPLRHGAERGKITLHDAGAAPPAASWSSSGERARLSEGRLLFAYGRYRRVQLPEAPRLPFEPLGPGWTAEAVEAGLVAKLPQIVGGRRTTTLFRPDNDLLGNLGRYLVEIHQHRSDPRFDEAWKTLDAAVAELGEGLEGLHAVEREGRDHALLRRRGRDVELRELSDGYQAMLVIVLDLALRFVFLPPAMEEPRKRAATVVIDEVDLHLHPRWQRLVVRQLTRLFPETQLVLTTHSPAVVQSAIDDGHSVLRLVDRDGATQVEPLDEKVRKKLRGAHIGSLIADDVLFGSPSRFSERFAAVERRVKKLRRKLERGTATPEDRENLLASLDTLEDLMADEEARWAKQPLMAELAKVQIASLKQLARMNAEAARGPA